MSDIKKTIIVCFIGVGYFIVMGILLTLLP